MNEWIVCNKGTEIPKTGFYYVTNRDFETGKHSVEIWFIKKTDDICRLRYGYDTLAIMPIECPKPYVEENNEFADADYLSTRQMNRITSMMKEMEDRLSKKIEEGNRRSYL